MLGVIKQQRLEAGGSSRRTRPASTTLPRQALGIRRLDRTAFSETHNKPRLSSCRLIPPEGRPEAISPTASQGAPHTNLPKMVPPEKPPRRQMVPQDAQSLRGTVNEARRHDCPGDGYLRTQMGSMGSHKVSSQYQKEALSSSLADFEREYSEMCKEMCSIATNDDSSTVMAIQSQGCSGNNAKNTSPVCETHTSDNPYQSHDLASCSQSDEQILSQSMEDDAIETLLNSNHEEEEDCVDGCEDGKELLSTHMSREDEMDEDEGSSSITSTDSGPEFLTAEERAEMLDTLVTGGFSSSGGEDDVYMPHGGATSPTSPSADAVADRLRDLPDGKQKVRVTTSFRQVVDRKTFVRYSEPEHHAIASFGFLEDLSPSASSSAQSQSEDEQRGTLRGHPSHKASTRQPQTSQQKQSSTRPQQSTSSAKQAPAAKQQATSKQPQVNGKQPVKGSKAAASATTSSATTSRSVADGAASAGGETRKGKLLVRSAESMRGRPANRTVLSLKDESRKDNRLSNSSFEGVPLAGGDLSLSDSCCEDFTDTNA